MNEREIFAAALERPTEAERQAFLLEVCDGEMRQRIERLLAEQAQLGSFLDHPPLESDAGVFNGICPTIEMGEGSTCDDEDDAIPSEQLEMSQPSQDPDDDIPLGYLQPPTRQDSLGRLGHYEVLSIVGKGAFGTVLRAFDTKLERIVAIKVLALEMACMSPARKRFLREARTAAQIRHENVVGIYSVEEEPIPYLVMEYIPGKTLQQQLEEHGPLDVPTVLRLGKQISDGLAAAHEQDLIHRDIKPGNILLEGGLNERVKITDFGLARTADDASMTQSGVIAGTPMYMAPEQAHGRKLDQRADLFSLGSVLYQMLTGRPPFRASSTIGVLKRVAEESPRPIQEVIPEVPDWMCELVGHLHAKDPAKRYGSAREVSEILAKCSEELSAGRIPRIPDPVNPREEAEETAPAVVAEKRSSSRLHSPLVKIAAAVLVLLGVLGITEATGVTQFAVTVVRVATGSGTLVIETDDPGVKIAINGEEVTITGGGVEELTLRPGEYQIEATKDGRPVKRELVSITRNGRTVVRMSLEPAPLVANVSGRQSNAGWHGWPADAPPPAIAPFDAEQANAHQEAWAKYLGVPVEYENSLGMKFRLIPPGEFMMGSAPLDFEQSLKVYGWDQNWRVRFQSEAPQHKVVLTQPVYFGVTEVTQSQYEQVMGTNPSDFSSTGKGRDLVANLETGDHPVDVVSWNDAAEFCARLSQQEKQKPFYFRSGETVTPLTGTGYRLPTEAEWESACRAGTTTQFWNSDEDEDLIQTGWSVSNSGGRTHPAGELKANSFGLLDMHGNVYEWVEDSWDPAFYEQFAESVARDPLRPFSAGSQRVVRGGSWNAPRSFCRSSDRIGADATTLGNGVGLRVVLVVESVKRQMSQNGTPPPAQAVAGWHGWPADAPPPAIAPFDAEQAQAHQEAWAKHLGVPVEYENSLGMKFRLIPPGEFLMGSTPEEIEAALKVAGEEEASRELINSEAPQHKVILTRPVYIGVTEVTQAQYEQIMGANPSHFSTTGEGKDAVANLETSNHPVEMVSWNDAAEFCARLSQQEELKPFYFRSGETVTPLKGDGYRLPTEAVWEYACRAGTTSRFWSGDENEALNLAGWSGGNSGKRTHAVGELKANSFGLSDFHGNVWEWVEDGWDPEFYGRFRTNAAIDPSSPFFANSQRVFRGGGWYTHPFFCRSSSRNAPDPTRPYVNIGFRVVLPVDAVKQRLSPPAAAIAPFDARHAEFRARWRESAQAHLEAVKANPEDRFTWIQAAPQLVLAGDDQGYRQLCEDMLEQFRGAKQPDVADAVCKVCLLRPGVIDVSRLPAAPIGEAAEAPEWSESRAFFVSELTLISYRQGQMQRAIEWAEKLAQGPSPPDLAAHTVRAMALYRLGRIEEAKATLATVETNFPEELRPFAASDLEAMSFPDTPLHHDLLHSLILHREAVRLIRDTAETSPNAVPNQ